MATSLYVEQFKSLLLRIPKKRGTGFCLSVFGFHHRNANLDKFEDLAPEWFIGDTCDIDGYLHIELKLINSNDRYKEGLDLTLKALKEVFPHVSEFKNDDDTFWVGLI